MVLRGKKACKKCKQRKVKCDYARPACHNCQKTGNKCTYEFKLLWRDEAEARGIAFGRENLWSKPGNKPSSTVRNVETDTFLLPVAPTTEFSFVNFTSENLDLIDDYEWRDRNLAENISSDPSDKPSTESSLLWEPSWLSPLEFKTGHDDLLYDYYVRVVLPSCTLYDDESNGFRFVILPMASTSSILLQTVLAVSAFAYSSEKPQFKDIANFHKQNVLDELSGLIQRDLVTSQLQVLATVMMLCIFELKNGCSPDWLIHMKGAIAYCESKFKANLHDDPLTLFAKKYFAYQLFNYESISSGGESSKHSDLWANQNLHSTEIDGHIGCSLELLRLVARISRYAYLKESHNIDLEEFEDLSNIYEQKLFTLQQTSHHLPVVATENTNVLQEVENLKLVTHPDDMEVFHRKVILILTAEARRHAAFIYLYSIFFDYHYACNQIQFRVKAILMLLGYINSIDSAFKPKWGLASLIWPAFIAGLHAFDFQDILVVSDFLLESKRSSSLGNVTKTLEILETVWVIREEISNMNSDIPNVGTNYEKYLDPIRWRITLG